MTNQRYAFFASISVLLLGCVLSQKHTTLPLAFTPPSGLSNSTSVSLTLTQSTADHQEKIAKNEITNNKKSSNETPKSPINTLNTSAANTKSRVTGTVPSAVAPITHKPTASTQQNDTRQVSRQTKTTQHTRSPHKQPAQMQELTQLSDNHSVDSQQAQIKKTQEKPKPILPSMEVSQPKFAAPPAQPDYPRLARKKGFEGITTLEVLFDQAGKQLSLKLISSSGFNLLDKAALEAVKKWRFSAPNEQTAYTYKVRVPIKFSLN
ncbi:energy transducer TonB [uncultured Shewanella sp.]|uniref:energy transducer TonB n=1 Tax=uncultured Shewanella sp. TaxID=173975 RepID=UPI0026130D18|nr:energy transducer TonB [uncultured Shewanella sp.]